MNVLFVCNMNQDRSKTAEELFKNRFKTKSAGLYNEKPLNNKQLNWADVIVVMEEHQRAEIAKRFPKHYLQKRIISFNIPDIYQYNQPELIACLMKRVKRLD